MASAVEQLAKNANWGALAKATELKNRILFVMGALLVYRLGTYIPLPGISPEAWGKFFADPTKSGGILGMFNMLSGGALQRMSIFALNIMPYISASIIMQLATAMSKRLEELKKEGEVGRMKINQYTRFLAVLLAIVQSYGMSVGLEASGAVIEPGMFFRISTVITIVGGTVFLMWLGEQITSRGVGNGVSLLIFAGIVAGFPRALATALDLGQSGELSPIALFILFAMVIGVIALIVYVERAQRRVVVQYPKRQVGNQLMGGETNHIPLKINTAGVIPPIFASSLLLMPLTVVGMLNLNGNEFMSNIVRHLQHGQPVYMALYGFLIAFFCFFYTAIVFNPEENAETLRKYGGFIPGIRPGKNTADYLDYILTRISVIGAGYIVFICLLPEFIIAKYALPFAFGGTSLLIVVSVTMDTVAQIHSHLIAHQYEGLMKKAKLRGRRR